MKKLYLCKRNQKQKHRKMESLSIEAKKKMLNSLAELGANEILKGLLPKNFMVRLTNKGIPNELAKVITDKACKIANEFSHYKIGGKYCKENKYQNY